MKKKGLGRSFDSLIPTTLLDEAFDPTAAQDGQMSQLQQIAIDQVVPDPDQPRRHFDEAALAELAASVKNHGVVQPLVVIPQSGRFIIVAGERRWRAAKQAGLTTVPCIVRSLSAQNRLEISLIENLQRRDLNPLETATAYLKLREQFNLSMEEIGQRVGGKSVSAVSNKLRLLRLPKAVQSLLHENKLTEGQVRPLINLPADTACDIAQRSLKEDWSARKIEQVVALWRQSHKATSPPQPKKMIDERPYVEATEQLIGQYQAPVKIRTNTRGAGQIIIPFKNAADFQRLRELLAQQR